MKTQNLDQIFDTIQDAVFTMSVEENERYQFTYVNRAFLNKTGFTASQVVGRYLHEVMNQASMPILLDWLRKSIEQKKTLRWEDRTQFPAGVLYGEVAITPVFDQSGKCITLMGMAHDTTELKQSRQDLERSYSLLKATLESTADGIIVVSNNDEVSGYNQKMLDLWNIPQGYFESRCYSDALQYVLDQLKDPDHCVAMLNDLKTHPEKESFHRLDFKDGRVFERYSRPQKVQDKIVGRVFSYRDITERVHAEEKMKDYALRLKTLSDASRSFAEARLDLKAVLDTTVKVAAEHFQDGCIVRLFNEEKTQLNTMAFHHVSQEVLALMSQILPHQQAFMDEASTQELLRTHQGVLVDLNLDRARERLTPLQKKMLEKVPVHCWIIDPLTVAGEVIGTVTILRHRKAPGYNLDDQNFLQELSDRAALTIHNAQLYESVNKSVRLRDEFISVASHELKTPLTALDLQLQIFSRLVASDLVSDRPGVQKYKKIVMKSNHQINRLLRLINDMLSVTKLSVGQFEILHEKTNLFDVVTHVVEQYENLQATGGSKIELSIEPDLIGQWDRVRLEQLVDNLLSNAIKFGQGKPIKISTTHADKYAVLKIQDSGIGMAKEDQGKVFDRFQRLVPTNRFGGLGLGLYIAKQIALAHGGTIEIESELDQGSIFTVKLPLS